MLDKKRSTNDADRKLAVPKAALSTFKAASIRSEGSGAAPPYYGSLLYQGSAKEPSTGLRYQRHIHLGE